jgi:predicted NodU family carbamoyl transferase
MITFKDILTPQYIGLSAFYHDSAACLPCDGAIAAAAQEELFKLGSLMVFT